MRINRFAKLVGSPGLLATAFILTGCETSTTAEKFPMPDYGTPSTPTPPSNAELAFQQAKNQLDAKWTVCTENNRANFLFTKVVPPKVETNPFAPQLVLPNASKDYGFYQFTAPVTYRREQSRLTLADNQNGLRERYVIAWYTPSYRTWTTASGKWSAFQTGRAWEKDNVKFLESVVTLLVDGTWKVEEKYFIMTTGVFVKPKCDEIPGG